MFYTHTEDQSRFFYFRDEAAHEAALEWYNATPKKDIIKLCDDNGVNIHQDHEYLVQEWVEIAIELYAKLTFGPANE